MEETKQKDGIKILKQEDICPAEWTFQQHDFEHLKEEKMFFCKKCGLIIKYEKENK